MQTIMVELKEAVGDRSYPIHIGQDILDRLPEFIAHLRPSSVALVTDSNVAPLHGDRVARLLEGMGLRVRRCVLPAGEENKELQNVEWLCGEFLDAGMDRSSLLVALGGGVVGDMAGFSAACFMRGIRFVQIPTTIVAQVDSSVGGKTGVNHRLGKNTIGAFHQPSAVIMDTTLLSTLPPREVRAGLAEVIKHGMIADAELLAYLERNAEAILALDLDALAIPIIRSCEIKSAVVASDEKEQGLRAILNYGHTFGHAIESVTGYSRFLHGEAVALGMCAAGALGVALGMLTDAEAERQRACIEALGLPTRWADLPVDAAMEAMKHDKKARAGTLKFVVLDGIGRAALRTDILPEQARAAFQSIAGPA